MCRHKLTNKQKFVNTNRIKGAWKHAKDYAYLQHDQNDVTKRIPEDIMLHP